MFFLFIVYIISLSNFIYISKDEQESGCKIHSRYPVIISESTKFDTNVLATGSVTVIQL